MTEQDAKTKWCPLYRVATSGGDTSTFEMDNRPVEHAEDAEQRWRPTGEFHPVARCVGSRCMAWRWVMPVVGDSRGYCGLAGKP